MKDLWIFSHYSIYTSISLNSEWKKQKETIKKHRPLPACTIYITTRAIGHGEKKTSLYNHITIVYTPNLPFEYTDGEKNTNKNESEVGLSYFIIIPMLKKTKKKRRKR